MIHMTREEALQKAIDAAIESEHTIDQLQLSLAWSAIAALLPKESPVSYFVEDEDYDGPGVITVSVEELWTYFDQDKNGYYRLKDDAPDWAHKKWKGIDIE